MTGVTTKQSPRGVDNTVARLTELIAHHGLTLFAVFDHSGAAKSAGLQLRETKVVVFGSPAAGTPVMDAEPLAALDLPLRVLIWADGGQTQVSYTAPAEIAARYGLAADLATRLSGIDASPTRWSSGWRYDDETVESHRNANPKSRERRP